VKMVVVLWLMFEGVVSVDGIVLEVKILGYCVVGKMGIV